MAVPARPSLRPSLRLDEIYPPAWTFNPREPYGGNPFVAENAAESDFLSGRNLPLMGRMSVICHRRAAGAEVLDLVRSAGFECEARIAFFETEGEYRGLLTRQAPGSVVFQHVHPRAEAEEALYAVPRDLLTFLNDKANLAELVPPHAVPRRRLLPAAEGKAAQLSTRIPTPVVLKVPSEHSLGGGEGVRICRERADLRQALADFAPARELVVEELVEIRENWCLQYACGDDGMSYLGAAVQLVDDQGRHYGNWITATSPPQDAVALGREISARGAALGYRGVAGFDVVLTHDGRLLVLDLNFRLNASTIGLLYFTPIREAWGADRLLVRTLHDRLGWPHLEAVLRDGVESAQVLPFGGYSPAGAAGREGAIAAVLIAGREPEEISGTLTRLADAGVR